MRIWKLKRLRGLMIEERAKYDSIVTANPSNARFSKTIKINTRWKRNSISYHLLLHTWIFGNSAWSAEKWVAMDLFIRWVSITGCVIPWQVASWLLNWTTENGCSSWCERDVLKRNLIIHIREYVWGVLGCTIVIHPWQHCLCLHCSVLRTQGDWSWQVFSEYALCVWDKSCRVGG